MTASPLSFAGQALMSRPTSPAGIGTLLPGVPQSVAATPTSKTCATSPASLSFVNSLPASVLNTPPAKSGCEEASKDSPACGGDGAEAGAAAAGLAPAASGEKERLVRRRTTKPLFASSRRLTVDTRQKLIGDFIEKEADSGPGSGFIPKQHPAAAAQTPGMVLSVWGTECTDHDRFAPYFAQKGINFDGEISRMQHRIGLMSHRGYKPESPNQDDFFVLARPESLLLGVLDGHGPQGHEVAHFAQERLPKLIMERLRCDSEAWESAVSSSVAELCSAAREVLANKAENSGSTVTVAMLDQVPKHDSSLPPTPSSSASPSPPPQLRLRCAFLGDSIAVHARRTAKGQPWEVTQLTDIHRPDRPDEMERIQQAGGEVMLPSHPSACSRLLTPEWNLAMSRSFGDFHAVPYGLSSQPEFAPNLELDSGYEHLVLICSDGVWDVIPPAQAVSFVGKFRPEEAQLAAERLVAKAQLRWQESEDVVDDITAIVVFPSMGEES